MNTARSDETTDTADLRDGDAPDVTNDSFDRLAEEFAARCRRGESPSVSEYAARFPAHADRVRRLLPTVALMEQLKRDDTHDHAAAVRTGGSVPMPERLGEFRLLRELGRGGMGVVYEALQESLGRHVALKVIHHGHLDDRRRQRFTREAQAVAQLHHTNIVPIFAVGEHDGLPYYAMQYIAGRGLDAVVARWRAGGDQIPPPAERWRFVARIGAQAADALQFAHDQGVLHRDVKPANLLIDDQGAAWLTDFGLAKLVGQDDLTASGDVIGTLRYLAPEALHGATDHRGDVYSLGLTLYELLTLNPPFGDLSPSELLRHVSDGHPQRPRSFDPAIPRDLETIVLKAIAREPNDRYATAGAFADDLKAFLDDRPIRARRATPPERLWRWSRRNRALASLTAIAAGALVLAAVVGWAGYVSTTRALQRADENVALSLAVFGELFDKLAPRDDSLPPPPGRHQRRPPPDGPRPDRAPPADPNRREESADDTALLQTVLTFYEQFAQRNATNPRLESEAARAYSRVGRLYDRLGRSADAAAAYDRATTLLQALAARFPSESEYPARIVEIAIMFDPWTAEPAALAPLEYRLEQASQLAERGSADPKAVLNRVHVEAKLGAVRQRLGHKEDAESSYLAGIELASKLIDDAPGDARALLDRAFIREALAALLVEDGRSDEAKTLLRASADDLRVLSRTVHGFRPSARHLQRVADDLRGLGDVATASELDRLAAAATLREPPDGRARDREHGPPPPPRDRQGPSFRESRAP